MAAASAAVSHAEKNLMHDEYHDEETPPDGEELQLIKDAVAEAFTACVNSGFLPFEICEAVEAMEAWPEAFARMSRVNIRVRSTSRKVFERYFIERNVVLRTQVENDVLVAAACRKLFSRYVGPPFPTLYRGESGWNVDASSYGMLWSDDVAIARAFAEGSRASTRQHSDTFLLSFTPKAGTIICAMPDMDTGETVYLVDPTTIADVKTMERFDRIRPATSLTTQSGPKR
jgi:hypothetical protein